MSEEPNPQNEAPTQRTMGDYWTFKGYRMGASEFNNAMNHFYRGEIARSVSWRQRLDMTTNWAVITAGALLTFSLGDIEKPHFVIPLGSLLILMFLFIEARRYRYYELWISRVRLMETDFFGAMLLPPFVPSETWAEALTSSLLNPQFPVSMAEAVGRRLRQNYLAIFMTLWATWLFKISSHPNTVQSWSEMVERAHAGPIPGSIVLLGGLIFNLSLIYVAIYTMRMKEAPGEVMPRYTVTGSGGLAAQLSEMFEFDLPWTRKRQHVVYIFSTKADDIAKGIMKDLDRGVTEIVGRGMYTGQERPFLMCALAPNDLPKLKHLVHAVDPNAFVIFMGAQEVLGRGFHPLDPNK